jgi:hypothetical protein
VTRLQNALRAPALPALAFTCLALVGCAGHSDHTLKARSALDYGRPREALALYNEQLDCDSAKEVPPKIEGDNVLFLLDRATILQALGEYTLSSRDLELADKQVEVLDFSRGTLDDISKYMFSDDSGPYAAPPYEKLMVNTLNMMNYLVRGDLSGARVEARRLSTLQKYISEENGEKQALAGPGDYLAGFIFEKSHEPGEALRYYDEALQFGDYRSLTGAVQRLAKLDPYRSPRLGKLIDAPSELAADGGDDQSADVLIIVDYGRVPAKIAKRVPIGLALTLASGYISPYDQARANRLALQGLVTWVNFPALGAAHGEWTSPAGSVDGQPLAFEGMLAVDAEAQRAWKEHEGKVIASAITRMITRIVAGEVARKATGGGVVGLLVGLGTQATMTAVDTPDTRSWSTLPARIAFARVRLPAGKHTFQLSARGTSKQQTLDLAPGGWAVLNLTVLR